MPTQTDIIAIDDGVIHLYRDTANGSRVVQGYIATEKQYGNYHLRLQYRWGEKKFRTARGPASRRRLVLPHHRRRCGVADGPAVSDSGRQHGRSAGALWTAGGFVDRSGDQGSRNATRFKMRSLADCRSCSAAAGSPIKPEAS